MSYPRPLAPYVRLLKSSYRGKAERKKERKKEREREREYQGLWGFALGQLETIFEGILGIDTLTSQSLWECFRLPCVFTLEGDSCWLEV
jgi:hypothetical protein